MTLEELKARLPGPFASMYADRYGPVVLKMSADQIMNLVTLVSAGDIDGSLRMVLGRLSEDELLSEWKRLGDDWAAANKDNAEAIALQKRAAMALLKAFLAVALAAVGL